MNNDFNIVKRKMFNHKDSKDARELMMSFPKRKKLLNNCVNKCQAVLKILKEEQFNKCIIYNEFIDFANNLSAYLMINGLENFVYHSNIKKKELILEQFKNSNSKILICVKALDEGLNIPDIDLGIIVSSSSQVRQTIQRVGRLLRFQENKIANVFNLYVKNSKEEEWLRKRLQGLKGYNQIIWKYSQS